MRRSPACVLVLGLGGAAAKIRPADRAALWQLYESTGGANWVRNTNWSPTGDPCWTSARWVGVGCMDPCVVYDGPDCNYGRATALSLSMNGLDGDLGNWTLSGVLTNLTNIDLGQNPELAGTLPTELGEINLLQSLVASQCDLEGTLPTELGAINSRTGDALREIHLHYNRLSGSIPASLASHTQLASLDLESNRLTGPLPAELPAAMAKLQVLHLGRNRLDGTLPPLGGLSKLAYLDLDGNAISGSIPSSLGDARQLQRLQLSKNRLSGTIPAHLDNLWHVRRLEMSDNFLTGNLPDGIGKLANLEVLDVWNNSMSGAVPQGIRELFNLEELYLAHEHLLPIRKRHCGQRLPDLGKYSWIFVQREYDQMMASYCPDDQIYDTAFTWSSLQDSGMYEL